MLLLYIVLKDILMLRLRLHIEREARNRANLRETRCGDLTTRKARNRAGYENQV